MVASPMIQPLSLMQRPQMPMPGRVAPPMATPAPIQQRPLAVQPGKVTMPMKVNKKQPVKVPLRTPAKPVAKQPVAKPNPINQYLTNDTTYQQQMAAIQRALGDYQANSLQQENSYNTGWAQNKADLDEQKRVGVMNQGEDYGSRGMLRSGLYAVDNADLLNNFASQYAKLDQGRADYLMNLHQGVGNYVTSQQLAQQQARQDAINRRAIGLIGSSPTAVR